MCQVCQLSKPLSFPTSLEAGHGSWGGVRGGIVGYGDDERGARSMYVVAGKICRSAECVKKGEFIRAVGAYLKEERETANGQCGMPVFAGSLFTCGMTCCSLHPDCLAPVAISLVYSSRKKLMLNAISIFLVHKAQ